MSENEERKCVANSRLQCTTRDQLLIASAEPAASAELAAAAPASSTARVRSRLFLLCKCLRRGPRLAPLFLSRRGLLALLDVLHVLEVPTASGLLWGGRGGGERK